MSDEYDNNKSYQAQSSEVLDGSAGSINPDIYYVRPSDIPDQALYHAQSFIAKWVFCQDAKATGVQYFLTAAFTGTIGLILSWLMRP